MTVFPEPRHNDSATTAPGASDDETAGYAVGSRWVNTADGQKYVCVDATTSAAVWNPTTNFLEALTGATYSSLQDMVDVLQGAGCIAGGGITPNGTTYDVAAGQGVIHTSASGTAPLRFFDWSADTARAIADGEVRWVYVDYNSGTPIIADTTTYGAWDGQTQFPLGSVAREGSDLFIMDAPQKVSDNPSLTYQWLREVGSFSRDNLTGGLQIGNTGTRNITSSGGNVWVGLTRTTLAAVDTSASDTFDYYYRDGVGGWTKMTSQTQWSNTQWDDGSGTLATLQANRYAAVWVYRTLDGTMAVVFGQEESNSQATIEDSAPPTLIPSRLQASGFLIGRLIIQESNDTPIDEQSIYAQSFNAATLTDHSQLAGLATGDDHTQYQLRSEQSAASGYPSLDGSGLVPTAELPTSSETGAGIIELATQAETDTGTDDARAVTPLKLASTTVAGIDSDAIHDNVAGEIAALTLVSAAAGDHILIEDADDSNNKKRVAASDFLGGGSGSNAIWDPVVVATTANITLSGEQTIDGVLTSADRVLVKNQSTGSQNGIYVSAAGAWSRATDADEDSEVIAGKLVAVNEGSTHADTLWQLTTNDPITVDTTSLTFTELQGGGGGGETNTASNEGVGGVGVFIQKTGVNLEFKNINAGSSAITVTDDAGNNEIDIDAAAASETQAGVAELATQAETDAGTDDARIVTPLKLATTTVAGIDSDAIHDNVAGEISALTLVTAVSGDQLLIEDASDSNNKKRVDASDFISVAATESVAGVAEIATQAETDAGTDDSRFVTPLKLTNWSGLPGINWTGAWSSLTSYNVDDAVEDGGSSYICIQAHTNQQPPNATYWDLLASAGSVTDVTATAPITSTGGATPNIAINSATTTTEGSIEIATQAEVDAGTDATRAVTPATLSSSAVLVQDLQTATAVDAPTTTSGTFVDLSGMTLTTSNNGTADYLITFSMNIENSAKSKVMDIEILIDGVVQAASLRSSTTSAAAAVNELSTVFAATAVPDGVIIKVQWRTSGSGGGGTATAGARTLVIQGR